MPVIQLLNQFHASVAYTDILSNMLQHVVIVLLQDGEESVEKLVIEAREVFTAGDVYAAEDLWTFPIALPVRT